MIKARKIAHVINVEDVLENPINEYGLHPIALEQLSGNALLTIISALNTRISSPLLANAMSKTELITNKLPSFYMHPITLAIIIK